MRTFPTTKFRDTNGSCDYLDSDGNRCGTIGFHISSVFLDRETMKNDFGPSWIIMTTCQKHFEEMDLKDFLPPEPKCPCGKKAEYVCDCGVFCCDSDPCINNCGGGVSPI